MYRLQALLLILGLTLTPFTASAQTGCSMMAPLGAAAGISAQPHSCCPKGACDCSMKADTSAPTAVVQMTGFERLTESVRILPASSSFSLPASADGTVSDSSESPPAPDNTYQLNSQYRI